MSKKITTFMSAGTNQGEEIKFQYDEDNNLYINEQLVVTKKIVSLGTMERFFAFAASMAIIAQAIFTVLDFFLK